MTVDNGVKQIAFDVSYLHDSLEDLASAALALLEGHPNPVVVFMDEPGEHHLAFSRMRDGVRFEVRRLATWTDGRRDLTDDYAVLLDGTGTAQSIAREVYLNLKCIHDALGPAGYLERWEAHAFPISAYERLQGLCRERPNSALQQTSRERAQD